MRNGQTKDTDEDTIADILKHPGIHKSKCTDEHKRFEVSEDGDSWARYCDEFQIHKRPIEVKKDGLICTQTRMGGIYIYENGHMVMHAQGSKVYSRRELKDYLKEYIIDKPRIDEVLNKLLNTKKGES